MENVRWDLVIGGASVLLAAGACLFSYLNWLAVKKKRPKFSIKTSVDFVPNSERRLIQITLTITNTGDFPLQLSGTGIIFPYGNNELLPISRDSGESFENAYLDPSAYCKSILEFFTADKYKLLNAESIALAFRGFGMVTVDAINLRSQIREFYENGWSKYDDMGNFPNTENPRNTYQIVRE